MKKTIIYLTINALSVLFLVSCNNEEDSFLKNSSNISPQNEYSISFTYLGKEYSTSYMLNDDSTAIFADKNIEEKLKDLSQIPNLSTYLNKDGTLAFFDNIESLKKECAVPTTAVVTKSATTTESNPLVTFYKDIFYQGKAWPFEQNRTPLGPTDKAVIMIHKLGKMNDNTLSVKNNIGFSITVFEDKDYKGNSLTFTTSIENFDAIFRRFNTNDGTIATWKNCISSFIVNNN
ncbi:peptidase inhibitor family I36 protein [Parabacteroides sp. Marseille-P3160]|uniref:peptidase inhibitor family I36 protein n=1 Tax=Parabacteroides sp. Marseille-P3160 TaxID=1917887 RepID=UPI0009BA4DF8|nr:peptidase inhibitor family I36 protein [Parabacteroides sp. Marseille-P3160]